MRDVVAAYFEGGVDLGLLLENEAFAQSRHAFANVNDEHKLRAFGGHVLLLIHTQHFDGSHNHLHTSARRLHARTQQP
jgi:hypothetical protein